MAEKKRPFQLDGPERTYPVTPTPGSAPTTNPQGLRPTPVLTSEGYGIRNGIPYGRNEKDAQVEHDRRFKMNPGAGAALAAATRARTGTAASTIPSD